mgnify:CR=1 FL=1
MTCCTLIGLGFFLLICYIITLFMWIKEINRGKKND